MQPSTTLAENVVTSVHEIFHRKRCPGLSSADPHLYGKKSEFIRFLEYVKRYTAAFVLVMLTMLLEGYNFLWRECCCE